MLDNSVGDTVLWIILYIFIIAVSYILINMCYSYFNREAPLLIPYYAEETEDIDFPE